MINKKIEILLLFIYFKSTVNYIKSFYKILYVCEISFF